MTKKLPIRWRLTLWYGVLLAAALLIFCVALYFSLRQVIFENFEEQVRNEAAFALTAVDTCGDQLSIATEAVNRLEDDDHFIRLLDVSGHAWLDTSSTLGGVPVDQFQFQSALAGETRYVTYGGGKENIGIVTTPIITGGKVVGALQVGSSRGDAQEILRIILLALSIAGPLVLIFAALGGYLLAGRALGPVSSITALAAGMSADDLHSRLNLNLPDDELGRLSRTFDAMLDRIEDSFEQQRRFTADAAHELRTPLSLLRSQVDLALSRRRSIAEYREALLGIDQDVDRMTGLVSRLLVVARSDGGRLQPETGRLDLPVLIKAVIEQYGPAASEAGIAIVDESSPVRCEVDGDLIVQLLVNLMDNALAHTGEGGFIRIGCIAEKGNARLWVEDTGSGISPEHQNRVFDRFYRVDSGRARSSGGVGLGLSIARAIAEAHGGAIALTSEVGRGTRVEVTLPLESALH